MILAEDLLKKRNKNDSKTIKNEHVETIVFGSLLKSLIKANFNPIKAGRSASMYSLGGGVWPPSRKMPDRIGIVLKCMCIAQFANGGSLRKIRPITLIVWVLVRVEKNAKKGSEK